MNVDEARKKMLKAIETLTGRIEKQTTGDDALKLTQASLNLAHAVKVLTPNT